MYYIEGKRPHSLVLECRAQTDVVCQQYLAGSSQETLLLSSVLFIMFLSLSV